ncbi:MAG: tetratricopeptide repeat protein [Bacteroidota bacterium]|nr:tetratricopeptide repeat protein [Bacteroidota bacterium]MDP3144380.1 tetratricopeptide repeat protein [Bacteroidota bacterium]
MNSNFKHLFILLFSISASFLFGQKTRLDSLYEKIKTTTLDTNKLKNINALTFELVAKGQLDTAHYYCNLLFENATNLAKENPEKESLINKLTVKTFGDFYNTSARCYYFESKYGLAKENFSKAIPYYLQIGFKKGVGACYQNIGNIYYFQGDYEKALKNYLEAAKIYETLNYAKGIADMHVNMGSNYRILGKLDIALEHYLIALKKYAEIKDQLGIAMSYMNMGIIHFDKKEMKEALENHQLSLKIKKELNDNKGIAECHINIAAVYSTQHKNKEALENYLIAEKIYTELNDKQGLSYCYNYIGDVYGDMKEYPKSIEYLTKGLKVSEEIGFKDMMRESYKTLAIIYALKNDYKSAYQFHQKYTDIKDTLFNQESTKKFAEMNASYENDKKEKEIKLIKAEQEKERVIAEEKSTIQKIIIYSVLFGLLLVVVFAAFVVRTLKHTKYQKTIIEEKQKEILDSIYYAKRIQTSLLPTEQYIERNLNKNN